MIKPYTFFSLFSSNPNLPKFTTQFGIRATDPILEDAKLSDNKAILMSAPIR